MKNLFALFSVLWLLSSFSSCGNRFASIDNASEKSGKEFLGYLLNGDAESLKGMFCERTLALEDFDEQLQTALEFIDGNIVSHGRVGGGSAMEDRSGGEITVRGLTPHIEDIMTDTGKQYLIFFDIFTHYKGHEDVIGITRVVIKLMENGEEKEYIVAGKLITRSDVE